MKINEVTNSSGILHYVGSNEPLKKYIEYVHIDDLDELRQGYGGTYTSKHWDALAKSIKDENGLLDPIHLYVDRKSRTSAVSEGNHRITVAKKMGYSYLPTVLHMTDHSTYKHRRSDVIPSADDSVFHPSHDSDGNWRKEYRTDLGKPSEYLRNIRTL